MQVNVEHVLPSLKIATGRALIAIVESRDPLTREEVNADIARRNGKDYDAMPGTFARETITNSLAELVHHLKWTVEVNGAYMASELGLGAYEIMKQKRQTEALRFWRTSNSPNVNNGPRIIIPDVSKNPSPCW